MNTQDSVHARAYKFNLDRIAKTVVELYKAGFNVIPVFDKKPLTSWSSEKRLSEEELNSILSTKKFNGVAIVAGPENPLKESEAVLVIVDVDNPDALERYSTLKQVVEKTARWWTGPRCPKCNNKHVEVLETGNYRCTKCGTEFTIVEAKRGLGALLWISKSDVEKYLRGTLRSGDVEILVRNYALIPPSKHPSGVFYEWIKEINLNNRETFGIHKLSQQELEAVLKEIGVVKEAVEEKKVEKGCKELDDNAVIEIVNSLRKAYVEKRRDFIVFFLTGWFRKANVCYESARRVIEILAEGDEEKDQRIYVVDRTYGLRGNPPSPEEMKGKTGLLEILEQGMSEEEALAVIEKIESILGTASPYRDSVYAVLDYEKQLYAVANLRKKIVVRARRTDRGFIYKEIVINASPVRMVVYDNPIGGIRKLEVVFESEIRRSPLVVGPATVEEVVGRLRAEGLVRNSRLVEDVFNAIVEAYIRKGRAEIREEVESPGFYLFNGRVVSIKYDIKPYTVEELREALELLNELAEKWFSHAVENFSTVVKWGIVAPFNYIYKQMHRRMPWMFLYGTTMTGKTTLGEIVLNMWGLDSRYIKTGASIDTIARLGYVLSMSTFPVLVNEPGGALSKEEIVETIKNAVEELIVRGKFTKGGTYTEFPSLASVIFTSNRYLPRDDALLRRFVVLQFTYGDRIDEERARVFESEVKPRLRKLSVIGQCVSEKVVNNKYMLTGDWRKDAETLMEMCFQEAGLEIPVWLKKHTEQTLEDYHEAVFARIIAFMVKRINEEHARHVGRVPHEHPESGMIEYIPEKDIDLRERAQLVLQRRWIPWASIKEFEDGSKYVVITTPILDELRPIVGDISLKSLAELLNWRNREAKKWDYRKVRTGDSTVWAIVIKLEDFLNLIAG